LSRAGAKRVAADACPGESPRFRLLPSREMGKPRRVREVLGDEAVCLRAHCCNHGEPAARSQRLAH
jgi:hypothetical protein